jgi:hypothetical protein
MKLDFDIDKDNVRNATEFIEESLIIDNLNNEFYIKSFEIKTEDELMIVIPIPNLHIGKFEYIYMTP